MLIGMLTVSQGVSRVNGIPLAICGDADPFGSATNFLAGRGFGHGSQVVVSGSHGTIGDTAVFCMTDVQAAALDADLGVGAKSATIEETVVVTVRKIRAVKPAAKKTAAGKTKTKKKTAGNKTAGKKTTRKRTGQKSARRKSSKPARKSRARTAAATKGSRKR